VGFYFQIKGFWEGFRKSESSEINLKDLGCQAKFSQGSKQVLGREDDEIHRQAEK
jgi:hypothetical protein